MKTDKVLAFTFSLALACFASSAFAQTTNDAPKAPAAKSAKKADTNSKTAKKPAPSTNRAVKLDSGPLTPGPAVGKEKNVNVRGQAAISSEVVAHLKRGDRVQVIEEVTLKHPKTDEPAKWAKIALPASAGVWANASFI